MPTHSQVIERLAVRVEELERERDAARAAARELTQWVPKNIREAMRERCPWIKEEPVSNG